MALNITKPDRRYSLIAGEMWFRYPSNPKFRLALDNLTIEFTTVLGIYGLSGSGKSTLGKIIGSVLQPTAGTFRCQVQNCSSTTSSLPDFKYLPQEPEEFFLGVKIGEAINKLLKPKTDWSFQQFTDFLKYLGLPFAQVEKRFGYELSTGQLRKAALAFGLAFPCDGIVLDEPTLGLSPAVRLQFEKLLTARLAEKAIFVISHDFNLLRSVAEKIIVMEQGQVVFQGGVEVLLSDKQLVERVGISKFALLTANNLKIEDQIYEPCK